MASSHQRAYIGDMSAEEPGPGSVGESISARPGTTESSASPAATSSSTAASGTANGDLTALEFGIHKSLRYHAKRRAFFDTFHRAATAIIAIAGSAAFFALIGDKTRISEAAAIIVVFFSTIDFVFAFPEKAREHDRLYERFSDLAAKLARLDKGQLNLNEVNELRSERLMLEKGEPSSLDALNVICHNEEAEARGYGSSDRYKIGGFQRLVAPFVTLPWFTPRRLHDA
jgi:hypothetical protein